MRCSTRLRRWLIGGLGVLGVFAGPPAAKAVFQVFTASGVVTSITSGGELDTALDVGDPFVAVAVFDDALLTGVDLEEISLNPNINPGHSFDLTIGDPAVLTFDEREDADFDPAGASGFPEIEFFDGSFTAFDFLSSTIQTNGGTLQASLRSELEITNEDLEGTLELTGEIREINQEPISPD